ncbi:MAG: ROK family transcriptional regulator [Velocimicrobium sp.]
MKHGMNSNEMQKTNRSLVLKILLENGSMTRTELSGRVGLQKATITNIINEFLEMGIIAIDGDLASGRRGELICLKLNAIYIMSISINRKDYQIRISTPNGEAVNHVKVQFAAKKDIYEILDGIKTNAMTLIEQYGKQCIIGVSLGLPGPYIRKDMDDDKEVNLVSEFEQLSMINIHKELESALGLQVMSEHDAKLSAYAEWKNAEESHINKNASLITLTSIGIGIGAGIIINGNIVEGQLGIAGEIGHMGINYNGKHINNKYESTFEYCAGTESSVRYMLERLYEFPNSVLNENSTYNDIINAYKTNDSLATYAVEKMAWMLGYGIANIIYIINPDCIILGQEYPDFLPFLDKVQLSVKQFVHPSILESVSIRCSKLSEDTVLLGGYYLVLEKLFKENLFLDRIREAID